MLTSRKYRTADDIRYQKITNELDKVKIRCSCGHRVVVPLKIGKVLCSWCGHYVYRDKQLEFKEKILEKMKRR